MGCLSLRATLRYRCVIVPLKQIESGIYGELIIVYPKPDLSDLLKGDYTAKDEWYRFVDLALAGPEAQKRKEVKPIHESF